MNNISNVTLKSEFGCDSPADSENRAALSTQIDGCRACGYSRLAPVLSLGSTPLANALPAADAAGMEEMRFPLDLVFCPSCSLLQITETVRPDILFSDYPYASSNSRSFVQQAEALAVTLIDRFSLGAHSQVVEIASNDGYLLQHYLKRGVSVLGIDPARNVADIALSRGIPTRAAFFNARLANDLVAEGMSADVIHANNVLAHVADLKGVVAGIAALLKPTGTAVIEVPYARDFIEQCEFDTIYHEHLCYFSAHSLAGVFDKAGLPLWDVEKTPFHGGTIRLFFRRADAPRQARATQLLESEEQDGLLDAGYYSDFGRRAEKLIRDLPGFLRALKSEGKRLAAYGASAKGATLLNVSGIGTDLLDFVADRSPLKQGRLMPGVHLPIVAPEELLARRPDYVLLLSWNFADEIISEQQQFLDTGGRFIVPLPKIRIL